ncbi:MAG: hypothetical protein IT384_30620 [Deltaproteobacteria bacterium]|nr:hypothetical protein [Deltaproteobacteria bacterium]
MKAAVLILTFASSACHGSSGGVAAAIIHTTIAATASGVRRADGDCYVDCTLPRECNKRTGLCELPCGGCPEGEMCTPDGSCVLPQLFTPTASTAPAR